MVRICVYVCSLSCPACNAHMHMQHIVNCELPSTIINFHLSHKRYDVRKKCCFPLQTLSEKFLILRRIDSDMVKYFEWSLRKQLLLCPILKELEFSRQFFEKETNI